MQLMAVLAVTLSVTVRHPDSAAAAMFCVWRKLVAVLGFGWQQDSQWVLLSAHLSRPDSTPDTGPKMDNFAIFFQGLPHPGDGLVVHADNFGNGAITQLAPD